MSFSFGIQIYIITDRYKIFVKPLFMKSTEMKTLEVYVKGVDTIENVKCKIHEMEGISPSLQQLSFAGKQLEDKCTLNDYMITVESTLHLMLQGWRGKQL